MGISPENLLHNPQSVYSMVSFKEATQPGLPASLSDWQSDTSLSESTQSSDLDPDIVAEEGEKVK